MIRKFRDTKDNEQAIELSELCYHESKENFIKFFKEIKEIDLIGIFEDDILLAAAGSHKFKMFVRNQIFSCSGIGYVMTHPKSRRKGYVKQLMNQLMKEKKDEGDEISALWPFRHSFYQKFGYENCDKTITYKFSPSNIKPVFKIGADISIDDITESNDFTSLNQVAENALNKYTRIIGDKDAWLLRGRAQASFKIYLIKRKNIPIAYISFKFRDLSEWEHDLIIIDLAFIDIEAKKTIFAFLRNFEADIRHIFIKIPYEEEMESYLINSVGDHKFNQWPGMVRILDVKKCLEKLIYPPTINTELYFKLKDDIITENTGVWKLNIKDTKCSAQKVNENSIESINVLDFTINQLTQVFIGKSRIERIFELELSKVPKEWLNTNLFPEVPCALMIDF